MTLAEPTQRFTDRVANYVRYRPGYPAALLDYLHLQCSLSPADTVADIGSGTGLLTRLFLAHGNPVYGVEPNAAMRQAAELQLTDYDNFYSQPGRAEATGLPPRRVDLVVAGQAFHWFELQPTRQEFQRILSPSGWVVLVWNNRDLNDPFQQAYEALLERYAPDYGEVRQRRQITLAQVEAFYAPSAVHSTVLAYQQQLDWAGLWGRLISCSYTPQVGQPNHQPLFNELKAAFMDYQQQNAINFVYQTQIYCGQLP